MECVIDTNVLIYDTFQDSELHRAASEMLSSLDGWLVPSVVMEEFVSVLVKLGVKKDFIKKKVAELVADDAFELVPIEPEDLGAAIQSISKEDVSFRRFNDKLVLSVAIRRRAPLFTFDKELEKQRRDANVDAPSGTGVSTSVAKGSKTTATTSDR